MQPFLFYTRAVNQPILPRVWGQPQPSNTNVPFVFTDDNWNAYAEALLREPDPFKAALRVFNKDDEVGRALWVSTYWKDDVRIKSIQSRLIKENGEAEYLPKKEDALKELWKFGQDDKITHKERIAAIKLLAEINGWIAKPDEKGKEVNEMPPAISFSIGTDHDKPPSTDNSPA